MNIKRIILIPDKLLFKSFVWVQTTRKYPFYLLRERFGICLGSPIYYNHENLNLRRYKNGEIPCHKCDGFHERVFGKPVCLNFDGAVVDIESNFTCDFAKIGPCIG